MDSTTETIVGTPANLANSQKLSAPKAVDVATDLAYAGPDGAADITPSLSEKGGANITSLSPGGGESRMPTEEQLRAQYAAFTEAVKNDPKGSVAHEVQSAADASPESPGDYSLVNTDGSPKVFAPRKMWKWTDNEIGRFMAKCEAEGLIPNEKDGFISTMRKTITMPVRIPIKAVQYIGGKIKEKVMSFFKKTPLSKNIKTTSEPSSMKPLSDPISRATPA